MTHDFRGSIVPVVTPFKGGDVDYDGLQQLIEWHIEHGAHGISVTGTTGEPTSLSTDERKRVIHVAAEAVNGRVPFVPGTGSNNHADTLAFSQHAREVGADALLLIAPYYLRPSQEGLFEHFDAVAKAVDLPIILYNIPGRTAVNIEVQTTYRLREANDNIIGIKESNKDFEHINRLLRDLGRDFLVYSGIELLCYPILAIGGAGYVSATANLMPQKVANLYNHWAAGEVGAAQAIHYEMMTLNDAIFMEINPVPVKTGLGMMGMIEPDVRLPLAPMAPQNRETLRAILIDYGLIE